MAAGHFRRLDGNSNSTDASSRATASVTPTNGARLYLGVLSLFSAAPAVPTASGTNGLAGTWTVRDDVAVGNRRLTVLSSTAVSAVAGVVTIDWAGETQLAQAWALFEGMNIGAEAPVQSEENSGSSVTSLAVTLAAFADPWNPTLMFVGTSAAFGTISPVSPLLQHLVANGTTDGVTILCIQSPVNNTGPSATFASADAVAIAMEIDHDGSDVGAGGGATRLVGGVLVS